MVSYCWYLVTFCVSYCWYLVTFCVSYCWYLVTFWVSYCWYLVTFWVSYCWYLVIFYISYTQHCGPGSSVGIATGYELDGPGIESRRGGARFFAPVQTGPGAQPASCTMDTGSFPGVKSGRCVTLTPYRLLVPWSRKSRAIPLLPLWAVRPVQSLSACTRVHFTLQ